MNSLGKPDVQVIRITYRFVVKVSIKHILTRHPMLEICRLLLLLLFAWSALAQGHPNSERKRPRVCQTKDVHIRHEYKRTAANLAKNMKSELEPCNDFYQFACGNFMERVQISNGSQYVDAYTHIPDTLIQQIRKIVTEERPETDPSHFKLPNKFFKSCMNTTLIDDLVDAPLRQILNSLGGWPLVVGNSWDSDNSWNWQDLATKLRRLGFGTDYIMSFSVVNHKENNTRNLISLYKPTFVLKSDFYRTSQRKYHDFIVNSAISFGAEKRAAIREVPKLINFEMFLVYMSQTEKNVNYFNNLVSIKQLQELYPYIQWLEFINALLPEGLTIDENEIINLLSPSFFDKLGNLLARTDKRTIANYIMWKFHYFSMEFLSKGFRTRRHQFDALALGTPPQENTFNACVRIVFQSTATKIFENLRNAFGQTLAESEWLDDKTKAEARRKLYSMKAIIGFPDELFDMERVEDYYRELEIDENKHFQSYLNIKTFDLDKRFRELRLPGNETEWLRNTVLTACCPANAITRNKIDYPAAHIQGQFFNTRRPNYMNYGSFGFVLAHEMTHSFAGLGCKYCADGIEREWWQPASRQALSERETCFIEQYSNYTDQQTGLKISGSQTLQENIADNSGAKLSYLAYKQWQAIHGKEPKLPGLKYTPQQLFWISFAQSFCGKFTPETKARFIKQGKHSPHEFRVLGVLRNMKDFSRDFHCPDNSPMNPVQKCEVW